MANQNQSPAPLSNRASLSTNPFTGTRCASIETKTENYWGVFMIGKNRYISPKKIASQPNAIPDAIGNKNIVELALCHVDELIGLAQDIASNMRNDRSHSDVGFHVSGRIIPLMHCVRRELDDVRRIVVIL